MGHPPDIAPTDFHLFKSLQNYLSGAKLTGPEDAKNEVTSFLDSKDQEFFKCGIYKLVERWTDVIANDGDYIDD